MEANNPYWFYLSCSQKDEDPYLKKFYGDLCREIAVHVGSDEVDKIGFIPAGNIKVREKWEREITEGLATSRTLVCLYSPAYFNSEFCGKEFEIFLTRVRGYVSIDPDASDNLLIFPILWSEPSRLLGRLPDRVAKMQILTHELGEMYAAKGLQYLLKLKQEKEYYNFLSETAKRLVAEVQRYPLPRMQNLPSLTGIPSAFQKLPPPPSSPPPGGERGSASKIDDVLSDFPLSPPVNRVLKRAADFAKDGPIALTTSALLFAINAEAIIAKGYGASTFIAKEFAAVPAEVREKVYASYLNLINHFPSDDPDRAEKMSAAAGTVTHNVLEVLKKAKEFSERTPKTGQIQVRHLLAALLLYKPASGETGARERLRELKLEIPKLREQFFESLKKQKYIGEGEGKDDLKVWRSILLPQPLDVKSRLPTFNADVDTEEDLLDIDDDVNAFAALIAAHSVKPPLSIGLFGDWGSGKSFFMRRLRKRISALAKESRNSPLPQRDVAFYRRIAQIEFNAWHYSESNLWASLVEYIFQNLKISDEDDTDALKAREEALLKEMKVEERAKAQAEEQEKEAQQKLEDKERALNLIETEHEEKTKELARLSAADVRSSILVSVGLDEKVRAEALSVLSAAGITGAGAAAKDLQSALGEARRVFERSSNLLTPLLKAEDGRKRFVMLLFILLAAPVVGLLAGYLASNFNPEIKNISAFMTGAATLFSSGAVWVRKQAGWMSEWLRKAESTKQEVDKQIDEQMAQLRAQHAQEIAQHRQELELIKTKYAALRGEREEAQQRLDQIRTELKQNTAAGLLAKFIQDRAASDDYRKYLGLLALIRRDFEELSGSIARSNKNLLEMGNKKKEEKDAAPINRIVLYIDDLDRCTPRQVATVLQAVHLLLAFPLFVVVVGVDVRWVARALRKQYPNLLGNPAQLQAAGVPAEETIEHRATPHDYLEKIFQIPFWLNPLEEDTTKKMVKGLMSITKIVEQQPEAGEEQPDTNSNRKASRQGPDPKGAKDKEDNGLGDKGADGGSANLNKKGTAGTQKTQSEQGKTGSSTQVIAQPPPDLKPDALDILSTEVTFVEHLTPLLGRSPRSVKRFINTYRLVKAGLSPEERAAFLDETSGVAQFRIVLFLLSIVTGLPSISRDLFQSVMDAHDKDDNHDQQKDKANKKPSVKLGALLENGKAQHGKSDNSEWSRLMDWADKYEKGQWNSIEIDKLADWMPKIARYSFNIRGL